MDPVSLALAVAPLCLSAITGAKLAKGKLRLLRNYDKEASRLRKLFKTQLSMFVDEVQLLLQGLVDEETLEEMLKGLDPEQWASVEIDTRLRNHLGRKYEAVKEVIQQIQELINTMDEHLSRLDRNNTSSGKVSATTDKARVAVNLVLNKSKLDRTLEDLVEATNEFRRLRKVTKAIQNNTRPSCSITTAKAAMPKTYGLINKHSASFYNILVRKWTCLNANREHSRHAAKLLLDTDASKDMDLRLILEYEATSGTMRQSGLLLVRIRSEDLSWVATNFLTTQPSLFTPSGREGEPPTKVRRVKFADSVKSHHHPESSDKHHRNQQLVPSTNVTDATGAPCNLCKSEDLCRDIFKPAAAAAAAVSEDSCIGYLDSAGNLRHRLLVAKDRNSMEMQTRPCSPVSLASLIDPAKVAHLSINEQLHLALRLARAVLQFHSTPWWRQRWCLTDLSYFDIDTELSQSLKTLHVATGLRGTAGENDGMELSGTLRSALPNPALSSGDEGGEFDDASLSCGIRNTTMYSLGTALLQIGHWNRLDIDDVVSVRRVARKKSRLGPSYDRLVEKCLYCDFGFGADLKEPQLQGAVYQNVVCELERLIYVLEGRLG